MNRIHVIYHIARADFLERVRRYSFLVMLGAVVFLGYQVAVGNLGVQLGDYRGAFNSAWVGTMMALIATFFLGWFGFYLVKGSVARDRETGVGQIMATTPLTRPLYTFGKWLSNFAVLVSMVIVLAIVAIAIQFLAGESTRFDPGALLFPFCLIALPMMALTAAAAVLFECIGFLQGGFGNVVYLFLFGFALPLTLVLGKTQPALDPLGLSLVQHSMSEAAKATFPDYNGGFVLGATGTPIRGVFEWSGLDWTGEMVLQRLVLFGIAVLLALVSALFFDRFDSAIKTIRRSKTRDLPTTTDAMASKRRLSASHLTPLAVSHNAFAFPRLVFLELKVALHGLRWWWFAAAGGLWIAALVVPAPSVRAYLLPATWLLPVLVWSGLGNREIRHNVQQMVFSCPAPLRQQLPASWLAGFLIALLTGSGVAFRLLSLGDAAGLLALISGALFIPTLALALGSWSSSPKLFEVVYVALWYLILNRVAAVDWMGATGDGNPAFWLFITLALSVIALWGRARQLQIR